MSKSDINYDRLWLQMQINNCEFFLNDSGSRLNDVDHKTVISLLSKLKKCFESGTINSAILEVRND